MVRKRASMLISFRSLMIKQSRRMGHAAAATCLTHVVAYSCVGSLERCRILGHGDHVGVEVVVTVYVVIVFDDACGYDGDVVRSVL